MMWVSVKILSDLINPLSNPPWPKIEKIYIKDIFKSIENNEFNTCVYNPLKFWNYKKHTERIAYLIKIPSNDPIVIDFGLPHLIFDGFHRLAAAIIMNQEMIQAEVYGPKEKIKVFYTN